MVRSHWLRVCAARLYALFRLAFTPAPGLRSLSLAAQRNSQVYSTKDTPQEHCSRDILPVHGFRFYFTPLAGVLFAFPSRYWFTIGQSGVFSLGGWSPHIQTGYHVSRPTLRVHNLCILVYGTITLYRRTFQTVPLTHKLIQTLGCSPFARRYWGNLG